MLDIWRWLQQALVELSLHLSGHESESRAFNRYDITNGEETATQLECVDRSHSTGNSAVGVAALEWLVRVASQLLLGIEEDVVEDVTLINVCNLAVGHKMAGAVDGEWAGGNCIRSKSSSEAVSARLKNNVLPIGGVSGVV
jgi:hypothetical protein